jgi:hypothetical protein
MTPVPATPLVAIGAGVYVADGSRRVIAACGDDEERGPEYEEQQRWAIQFAASTDLLAACQQSLRELGKFGMVCECGLQRCLTTSLREAIAKATREPTP